MRSVVWVVGLIAVAGCDDKPTKKPLEGPMPVTFGDCASVGTAWVSGPRPMPFTAADADNPWVGTESSALAAASPPQPADAPTERGSAAPIDPELARQQAIEAARSAGVLGSQHGPLVLRPVDTTTMKVVTRAIASVLAAGDDLVFASQSGTEWTLLSPMPLGLPLVPVPFGTGGMWNDVKAPGRGGSVATDRKVLSLHVGKDKIALAVSKTADVVSFSRDATAVQALGDALKAKKALPDFTNRDDIEIAIDSDLTYADYVAVVRTAIAAGFTHWRYTEPGSLAALAPH